MHPHEPDLAKQARRGGSRDEVGASTAEYAVGTVASTGFAGILYLMLPWIDALIRYCLLASGALVPPYQIPVIRL
jgi:hypothetical protein